MAGLTLDAFAEQAWKPPRKGALDDLATVDPDLLLGKAT
jgi:hypothetical protein